MADYTHTGLELVGLHDPGENAGPFSDINQARAAGYDTVNPVTGMYYIGAVIDGAFVPIFSEKASLVFDRLDLAKQRQQDEAAQQQAQADQPTTGPQSPLASPPDQPQG